MIFKSSLEARYNSITEPLKVLPIKGKVLQAEGTTNLFPKWHPNENGYVYLSNKDNDFLAKPICSITTLIQGNIQR